MLVDADKLLMGIETLNDYLSHRVMVITFTKKDGTERVMRCTKSPVLIPTEKHPKPLAEGEVPKAQDPQLFKVFDLDIQAWRSFRYSTVKQATLGTVSGV